VRSRLPSSSYDRRAMHVQNATLKALVQGEKQFRVPIWQRQYTWGVSQHEQMWHDLVEQYDALVGGHAAVAGHFRRFCSFRG